LGELLAGDLLGVLLLLADSPGFLSWKLLIIAIFM
jgi:hypothetical protein